MFVEENDFFSFEREIWKLFLFQTLALLKTSCIYRAAKPWRASQKRVVVLPIQIQICALKKLGDKAYRECSRHCPERSLSSSLNLGPKQHVLQDVISSTLDVEACWSLVKMCWCHRDVICFYHKEQLLRSFFGGFAYPKRSLCTSQTWAKKEHILQVVMTCYCVETW